MPIIKSAKKRVKVARKATIANVKVKRNLREALKAFDKAVQSGKAVEITKTERAAASALDKAAKKAVIHRNKASRQKAKLAATAKTKGVKLVSKAKAPAKSSAKKTTARKPIARKKVTK